MIKGKRVYNRGAHVGYIFFNKGFPLICLALGAAVVLNPRVLAPVQAADYSGTVLYPLTLPSSAYTLIEPYSAAAGQAAGLGDLRIDGVLTSHALLWSGPTGSVVDLNPGNSTSSGVQGTDGTQQVGSAEINGIGDAFLWSGTAASAINLNPTGYGGSIGYGVGGGQQVGFGYNSANLLQALLWSGTAASAVDLNPNGFTQSYALGTNGTQQVGFAWGTTTDTSYHAILWSGTAASAVDLAPAGVAESQAYGVGGNQQVGYGAITSSSDSHAFLWSGTAASAVDLNPAGFMTSYALGTNGTEQAGEALPNGAADNQWQAVAWSGTAASAINLQSLLPAAGTWTSSEAYSVDGEGDIFGTADGTLNGTTGIFAVEWTNTVPEPSSLLLLASSAGLLLRRKVKHR
jgi:hypothetical protein